MKKRLFKFGMMNENRNAQAKQNTETNERILFATTQKIEDVFQSFGSGENGLSAEMVEISRQAHGENTVSHGKEDSLLKRLWDAFVNPFTAILFVLAIVSTFTDIVFAQAGEESYATVVIITTMVLISGVLRFVQETRSGKAAMKLAEMYFQPQRWSG